MAAMKPRTGDGPLEVTKEGRGIVMRVPLEGGGRLVVELSADEAAALGARSVLVIGSAGGRLDHLAASLLLLGAERYEALELDALVGDAVVHVVRGERTLRGSPGDLVTLLPLGGAAEGVTTSGLEYPLAAETLSSGTTRGVSNVFLGEEARVTVASGVVLAICPSPEPKPEKPK